MFTKHKLNLILILILSLGIAMSCFGGWAFYDAEERKVLGEFAHDVDERAESFYREMEINFEALRSLAILFRAEQAPGAVRFQSEAARILQRYPAIKMLEWVPRVTHEQRDEYSAARRKVFPAFEISERSPRGPKANADKRVEYYPVHFVEPFVGNESVLGFDVASNQDRLEIMATSRDTGSLQATKQVLLLQGAEQQKAILVFLPVYTDIPATVEMRRKNLQGFVLGVFALSDIFKSSALIGEPAGIEMQVVDLSLPAESGILHMHKSRTGFEGNSDIVYTRSLPELSGQKWAIVASPTDNYIFDRRNVLPISIFALGVIFTLFMVLYIHIISRRSEIIQQTVVSKTMELNTANQKLEMISRTDGLTGIANRRYMDEFMTNEWLRAIRSHSSLSFILIDVDFFKSYNDNYGHPDGDEVLKKVAAMLKQLGNRPGDLVVRYGGDEFAMILTDTEEAEAVARNCLSSIADLNIVHEYSKVAGYVSLSVGLGTVFPKAGTTPDLVVDAADKALYLAKKAGRNRFEQVVIPS